MSSFEDSAVHERMQVARRITSMREMFLAYEETGDRDSRRAGIPEWHFRCAECGQSVYRLMSGGTSFHLTPAQLLDQFTAHVRQCHENELDQFPSYRAAEL